jgi:hypothetical protein
MLTSLKSSAEVIDALGGTKPLIELLHVGSAAVSVWRVRNRFPAHTFPKIQQELLARGMTADASLWSFARKKSERRSEATQ